MRFLGRAVFAPAVCLLLGVGGLRALDVSYGSLFRVSGVSRPEGKAVLPLSRGKYANVRVLDWETLEFVNACTEPCVQDAGPGRIKTADFRPAKTRGGMWIADVAFDGKWLITFLVFQNKNGYGVKPPEEFIFLDENLRGRVEKALGALAGQNPSPAREEKP